jgi:hypothetical protein
MDNFTYLTSPGLCTPTERRKVCVSLVDTRHHICMISPEVSCWPQWTPCKFLPSHEFEDCPWWTDCILTVVWTDVASSTCSCRWLQCSSSQRVVITQVVM